MKYKVGDEVRILDGRKSLNSKVGWERSMDKYIGFTGKVQTADVCDGTYCVAVDGDSWWYEEKWLAPAPEDIRRKVDLAFGDLTKKAPKPKRLVRNGRAMVVFWDDGTKTIVKRAEDEEDNNYEAFTAALAIKIFGSNSAVHRIVNKTEVQEKRKK